jgi:ATP-dependent DNA ligase
MEALLVGELSKDAEGWQFEPKWDGFRCLAFRSGSNVELKAKSGKSLSRFFPEVLANLRALRHSTFVLDGELVIPLDGELSFDALQMRLHPAQSRIKRLADETPATLIVFDCLLTKPRQPLLSRPFEERRAALEGLFRRLRGEAHGLALTPFTRELRMAKQWLKGRHASLDGVVAKRLDLPYRPGERAMLKIKRGALPTAWWAAFAMKATAPRSDRSCWASMTRTAGCIMWGLPPRSPAATRPLSLRVLRSSSLRRDSQAMRRVAPAAGARRAPQNGNP